LPTAQELYLEVRREEDGESGGVVALRTGATAVENFVALIYAPEVLKDWIKLVNFSAP
jgi:hypothetical protein